MHICCSCWSIPAHWIQCGFTGLVLGRLHFYFWALIPSLQRIKRFSVRFFFSSLVFRFCFAWFFFPLHFKLSLYHIYKFQRNHFLWYFFRSVHRLSSSESTNVLKIFLIWYGSYCSCSKRATAYCISSYANNSQRLGPILFFLFICFTLFLFWSPFLSIPSPCVFTRRCFASFHLNLSVFVLCVRFAVWIFARLCLYTCTYSIFSHLIAF